MPMQTQDDRTQSQGSTTGRDSQPQSSFHCSSDDHDHEAASSRKRPWKESVPSINSDMQQLPESGASVMSYPNGDVEITGGEFNATAGHRISVVINNSPNQGTASSTGSKPRSQRRSGGRIRDEFETTGTSRRATEQSFQKFRADNVVNARTAELSPRTSYATYYKHLVCQGQGSPLWITQPSKNLSVEYQRAGAQIGDVGAITSRGEFLFFFNICYPADHPFNSNNVPRNFEPLLLQARNDIVVVPQFGPNSFLSSASIQKSRREGNPSELVFESSAAEGAILTMPVGAKSEDAVPILKFRKYAAQHAADWYRYIIDERGYEVNNGDVRLVTGHDKTSAWGMAAFCGSTSRNALYLSFQLKGGDSFDRAYGWEHSGIAEVRSGPDPKDVNDLRRGDPSLENVVFDNQCLFVRTMNFKLQAKVWQELASTLLFDVASSEGPDIDPDLLGSSQSSSRRPNDSGSSRTPGSNTARREGRQILALLPEKSIFSQINPLVSGSHRPPATLREHPADAINSMLLNAHTNATMVVTNDFEWIAVLGPDDLRLPDKKTFYSRIQAKFRFCIDNDGVLFLEKRRRSVVHDMRHHPVRSVLSLTDGFEEHEWPLSIENDHDCGMDVDVIEIQTDASEMEGENESENKVWQSEAYLANSEKYNMTPLLVEVPAGRAIYKMVEKEFSDAWTTGASARIFCPPIKHVYKIMESEDALQPYERYKERVGNEVFRYYGTTRRCTLGSEGKTTLCSDTHCALCLHLKSSFRASLANHPGAFGPGIYTSSASNKAYSYTAAGSGAMLLTKVALGRVRQVNRWGEVPSCPPGYDSVVFDRGGGSLNETVVYSEEAIRPIFLITFR